MCCLQHLNISCSYGHVAAVFDIERMIKCTLFSGNCSVRCLHRTLAPVNAYGQFMPINGQMNPTIQAEKTAKTAPNESAGSQARSPRLQPPAQEERSRSLAFAFHQCLQLLELQILGPTAP